MQQNNYKETFPQLQEKVVLNVDDNELNQLVIAKIMANAGVKTVAASNGVEAGTKTGGGLKPDIILMDLEMPGMNGLQASACIKKNIDSHIPIIINSGLVSASDKWQLKRLGITDFLEKPYTMKDIFAKLSKNVAA